MKETWIYSILIILLILGGHKGRCGEFAITYTALCLAFEVKARLVVDMTGDHMWTKVWIDKPALRGISLYVPGKDWMHVDPTEAVTWIQKHPGEDVMLSKKVDNPLMYQKEWNKNIEEVLAFNEDGSSEDVTERYRTK